MDPFSRHRPWFSGCGTWASIMYTLAFYMELGLLGMTREWKHLFPSLLLSFLGSEPRISWRYQLAHKWDDSGSQLSDFFPSLNNRFSLAWGLESRTPTFQPVLTPHRTVLFISPLSPRGKKENQQESDSALSASMPNSTELYHLHFRQRENQTRWSLRSGQPWRSVLCFCFVISLPGASPCLQAVWSPISAGQTGPSEQGATRRFTLTCLDPSPLLLVPPLFQEGRKEDVFYLVEVSQSIKSNTILTVLDFGS